MEITLREREFDAVIVEPVPDFQQNLALDVYEAALRILDPDPKLQIDGVVAEAQQMANGLWIIQHAFDRARRLRGEINRLSDVAAVGNSDR